MKSKLINSLKFFIGWPLSVLALFFVFKIFADKSGSILPNLKQLNIQVLFYGILCYFVFFLLRCVLWQKILQDRGYNFKLKDISSLWMTSELKRYIPGNFWSFLKRAYLFSESGVQKKDIARSFLIEIETFLLGTLIISLLSVSFIVYNVFKSNYDNQLIITLLTVSTILLLLIFVSGFLIIKHVKIRQILFLKNILPDSSIRNNLLLLIISTSYMFFYGLGTYFVISSVVFLSPVYILTFIGFFVFSLLVGYLSFITPMGLGIREGLTTMGLSKFISLTQAGFASIFARVILILTELTFIAFVFFWAKTKNNHFLKIENFINKYVYEIVLLISIAVYTLYFTSISFLRYDNFYTGRFDLGNMDQTVWNTIHGRIFQMTDPNGTDIISRLSFHADFILILLSPFYIIWSHPKMLLLIQSIVVGFGAAFIYLIAKKVIKSKILSLAFSFSYLMNPSLQYANIYDFHAVVLATTFLLAAFYFLIQKKYIYFLIFSVLSALTKEQIWIVIALFGGYIALLGMIPDQAFALSLCRRGSSLLKRLRTKKIIFGITILLTSLFIFRYLIWTAIPEARGTQHFALSYYSDFGDSPGNIVKNVFLSPQKILGTILEKERIGYLKQLFNPVGFLPIFSPFSLFFALPDFLINLLSNNKQLHQIYYQYTSTITPFIFIASIFAVKTLKKRLPKIPVFVFVLYLTFSSLYSAYEFGPLPGAKKPNLDMIVKPILYKDKINDFLSKIPNSYSITASNNIGSHLSQRQKIYNAPININKSDYVIFLLNDQFAFPTLREQKEMAEKLKRDKNYVEIFKEGNFIAFKKIK